jgi:nucleoside-diphosphate-sugar epimerase
MKYYITGKGGFIGQHLVKHLKGLGHQIIEQIPDPEEHTIINLQAYGNHYHQKDISQIIEANILNLYELISDAREVSCARFINVSSSSVTLPHQTMYSAAKLFGEQMVSSFNDPRFVNVRPYSVYGPGEAAHRFIPTVIRALHTGETIDLDLDAVHDWIHVEDFITAMLAGVTEIGSGVQHSNLAIVRMLETISRKELRYNKRKVRDYDTSRWVCRQGVAHRNIYDGLKQTYESFTG